MKASYSTIFADDGEPISAVISYFDVTEEQEKEAIFMIWQQSLSGRQPESSTLFRYNLSKDMLFDTVEGTLLQVEFAADAFTFD